MPLINTRNAITRNTIAKQKGFTLVEIIIGILVFSISLAIIFNLISPTERNSADQIHQIKASELAQALMNDIMSRAFDENSDMSGGRLRCDEDQDGNDTVDADEECSSVLGPEVGEEGDRNLFDDVDDFNGYTERVTATNANLDGSYDSFDISVAVAYDGNGIALDTPLAKRISITVTTPLGTPIAFSVYKANF